MNSFKSADNTLLSSQVNNINDTSFRCYCQLSAIFGFSTEREATKW